MVKGTKRTNEKWLDLHAGQVIMLQQYMSKNKFREGAFLLTGISEKNISNRVQYITGHKYVSSTQRYQVSNLDELQNQLQQLHPMK